MKFPNAIRRWQKRRSNSALRSSMDRVEELAAAAIGLAAWAKWRYELPHGELRRLAAMRNLLEALAAIEWRRREGARAGVRLIAISDLDDAVELAISQLEAKDDNARAFAKSVRRLREQQWSRLHSLQLESQEYWMATLQLNEIYLACLPVVN